VDSLMKMVRSLGSSETDSLVLPKKLQIIVYFPW
jgi:hypothetical protein